MASPDPIIDGIVLAYVRAWNEPDTAQRRALLAKSVTEDVYVTYPTVDLRGREALIGYIEESMKQRPGRRFVLISGVHQHRDRIRYGWALVQGDGTTLVEATDVGELDPDSRLQRVTGFYGPPPPPPESWPREAVTR